MTEHDWLSDSMSLSVVLPAFSNHLGEHAERKYRLFSAACCRRVWHLLTDERSRRAVEFAERMADRGKAGRRGRPAVEREARLASLEAEQPLEDAPPNRSYDLDARCCAAWAATRSVAVDVYQAIEVSEFAAWAMVYHTYRPSSRSTTPNFQIHIEAERRLHRQLLREICDNPFRPVVIAPAWRTPEVLSLATAVYEQRAFDRMHILGDALEEAGCSDPALLAHGRDVGEHALGCWLIDMLLGKS